MLKPELPDAFDQEKKVNFWIAVDDLRVGGIQRLSLDEVYALNARGYEVRLFCARGVTDEDSMMILDNTTSEMCRRISYLPSSKLRSIFFLAREIRSCEVQSVVCHSPSLAILFRLSSWLARKSIKINLWIHQVLSFSSKIQATKRVLYAITASNLYFSSIQFREEWEHHWLDRLAQRFRVGQSRITSRLGVYIQRLKEPREIFVCSEHRDHLVFASRATAWKGLDEFLGILERNPEMAGILLSVNLSSIQISRIEDANLRSRIHVLCAKPTNVLANQPRLLHVYPTNYGLKVRNPQSIGLNVLEFAALGIPSLVSFEPYSTYPEIYQYGMVETVDWTNTQHVDYVIKQKLENFTSISKTSLHDMLGVISIETHINTLIVGNSS